MPKQKRNSGNSAGWKDVSTGGGAPFPVWKKDMVIEGVVSSFREYTYKKKPHKAMEIANTDTGEMTALPDNYALQNLFNLAKVGDMVRVTFLGKKKIGKDQTLLEFRVQHKPA